MAITHAAMDTLLTHIYRHLCAYVCKYTLLMYYTAKTAVLL